MRLSLLHVTPAGPQCCIKERISSAPVFHSARTPQKRRFFIHHIMPQITTVHLAAIFLLTCLTAQVVSQTTSSANSTMSPMSNQTVNTNNGTMATSTYVGPMNTTTAPAGTAYQLQSSALFVVISGTIATMLVHYCC
ncbi:hypothetical protein AOLI_G00309140 [Acnodon oligacanthus]